MLNLNESFLDEYLQKDKKLNRTKNNTSGTPDKKEESFLKSDTLSSLKNLSDSSKDYSSKGSSLSIDDTQKPDYGISDNITSSDRDYGVVQDPNNSLGTHEEGNIF